jgi:hypothetical protein
MIKVYSEIDRLMVLSDDDLLLQIGESLTDSTPSDDFFDNIVGLEIPKDVRELGWRLFRRSHDEFHNLICGTDEADFDDRKALLGALGKNETIVAVTIAAILMKSFAISFPIATALAVLINRRFILPTIDETCKYWGDRAKEFFNAN